jgi:hypothetical protein
MPGALQILEPLILCGPSRVLLWQSEGYSYGHNSSGCWQRYIERGRRREIDLDYQFFFSQGWETDVKYLKAGLAELTATAGWNGGTTYANEYLDVIWEIDNDTIEKGLLECDFPNAPSITGGLNNGVASTINLTQQGAWVAGQLVAGSSSQTSKQAVQAAVNDAAPYWSNGTVEDPFPFVELSDGTIYNFDSGADPADAGNSQIISCPASDFEGAYSLFLLMRAGNTTFPVDAPAIKCTRMFSNLYATQVSYANVGRIISQGSMGPVEGVPDNLLFNATTGINPYPNSNYGQTFIETVQDLAYGFRKARPRVSQVSLWKWKVEQVYQYGLWPIRSMGLLI